MKLPRLNRDYLPAIGLGVTQIVGHSTLLYAYAVLFQTATLGILSALVNRCRIYEPNAWSPENGYILGQLAD